MENRFENMDVLERLQMLKAMEFICRNINSEEILETWLILGVADGDIVYGDLSPHWRDLDNLGDYISDNETFADLMDTFLLVMREAAKDGGLYCNGVVSQKEADEDAD